MPPAREIPPGECAIRHIKSRILMLASVLFLGLWNAFALHADEVPAAGDRLQPLRFLVGSCWRGTFADGKNVDTHCFSRMYGEAFIRDVHLVRGDNPDYRGEAIYQWDPAGEQIKYRYWNSLGGVSDGVLTTEGGRIIAPGERHVENDGGVIEIRSVMQQSGDDTYSSIAEQKTETGWVQMWKVEFSRLPDDTDSSLP